MDKIKKDKPSGEEMSYGDILPDGRVVVKGYDAPTAEYVDSHDRGRYV